MCVYVLNECNPSVAYWVPHKDGPLLYTEDAVDGRKRAAFLFSLMTVKITKTRYQSKVFFKR